MRTQLMFGVCVVLLGCTTPQEETITVYQALSLGGCEDEQSQVLTKQVPVTYTEQERTTECSVFVDLRYINKEEPVASEPTKE